MAERETIDEEVAELVAQALSHALVSPLNSVERRLGRITKPAPSSNQLDQYNHHVQDIFRATREARYLINKKRDAIRTNLHKKYSYERSQFLDFIGLSLEPYVIDVDRTVKSFHSFAEKILDSTKDKKTLEQMRVSAQHFREIYNGIRRFVEHKGAKSDTSCDVNNQLTLCLGLIEAYPKCEQIEIFGKGKVQFDQTLLRTMFIEIITNSLKYARIGEKPILRIDIQQPWMATDDATAPRFLKTADATADYCKIVIADNGMGIPADEVESVTHLGFRSFAVRDKIAGSGSGLAICKLFVERAGGHIWITSEHLRGTMVHIVLPGSTTKIARPSVILNTSPK
jgi:signal transduction histidine kinase